MRLRGCPPGGPGRCRRRRQGVARTESLISASLSPRYARHVTSRETVVDGVRVVEVRVVAPVPVLGLLGPDDRLDVVGRAFLESQ